MKYKNTTKGVLKFRAFNVKMEKEVFIVEPGKEIELGKEINFMGMEKVKEKEKKIGGKK